jgi:exodeoxyribonuclease V alpha subunit
MDFELSDKQSETIKATIERIIWRAPDGGDRVILSIKPHGRRPFSAIGNMTTPHEGQEYEFTGDWKFNPRYNRRDLHFFTYRTVMPEDHAGIYHYLVHTAKWIGPETATKLCETFGDDTLRVLKEEPHKVNIAGLTHERIKEINRKLLDNEAIEAALVEVGNMIGSQLGPSTVQKAITKWGANAAHILKRDPHRLAQLRGIGFLKADALYLGLGGDPGRLRRHVYAGNHVLAEEAAQNGHTIVDLNHFNGKLTQLVGQVHPDLMRLATRALQFNVDGEASICSYVLSEAESEVCNTISQLCECPVDPWSIDSVKDGHVKDMLEELADDQVEALNLAMNNNVCIITGAPGTGKTFTIARIMAALRNAGCQIKLAAPTGKAAKQMELALSSTIGLPARTIHSLLEPEVDDDGEFRFSRNKYNPIECNVLVVDEASMIDIRLMRSLMAATPRPCRLIIVGDRYQLPSVGPGAVLRDLIKAGVPFCELSKIKRNAGLIVKACHSIKDGKSPKPASRLDLDAGDNWRHVQCQTTQQIRGVIEQLIGEKLKERGIDPVWQAQIISPINDKGSLSCYALNGMVKALVNPGYNESRLGFSVGDKVVRCRNGQVKSTTEMTICPKCQGSQDPDEPCPTCNDTGKVKAEGNSTRIVNGDIGVVKDIDKRHVVVDFLFPDRSVMIPRQDHQLKLAYCMTCHKMQGSEIDVVILPITRTLMKIPMVNREWIYTAMSRPKVFMISVGQIEGIAEAIRKVGITQRRTALVEKIQQCQPSFAA